MCANDILNTGVWLYTHRTYTPKLEANTQGTKSEIMKSTAAIRHIEYLTWGNGDEVQQTPPFELGTIMYVVDSLLKIAVKDKVKKEERCKSLINDLFPKSPEITNLLYAFAGDIALYEDIDKAQVACWDNIKYIAIEKPDLWQTCVASIEKPRVGVAFEETNNMVISERRYVIESCPQLAYSVFGVALNAGKHIRYCKRCGALFVSGQNKDEYCRWPDEGGKTCGYYTHTKKRAKPKKKVCLYTEKKRHSRRATWRGYTDLDENIYLQLTNADSEFYAAVRDGTRTEEEYTAWLDKARKRKVPKGKDVDEAAREWIAASGMAK